MAGWTALWKRLARLPMAGDGWGAGRGTGRTNYNWSKSYSIGCDAFDVPYCPFIPIRVVQQLAHAFTSKVICGCWWCSSALENVLAGRRATYIALFILLLSLLPFVTCRNTYIIRAKTHPSGRYLMGHVKVGNFNYWVSLCNVSSSD
jgi:hypothetical protein